MFGMGPWELFIIFLAILLLFGARRLPEMAQGMGKGIREFRKALKDTSEELKGTTEESKPSGGTSEGSQAGTEPRKEER